MLVAALFVVAMGRKPSGLNKGKMCETLLSDKTWATAVEVFAECNKREDECGAVMKEYKPPSCDQSKNKNEAYCKVYKACQGEAMVDGENDRQVVVRMGRAVEDESPSARLAGLYEDCNRDSDCASGKCDYFNKECTTKSYRAVNDRAPRDNGCLADCLERWSGSNFCYEQCGTHRSVSDDVTELLVEEIETRGARRTSNWCASHCGSHTTTGGHAGCDCTECAPGGRQNLAGRCGRSIARSIEDRLENVLEQLELEAPRIARKSCSSDADCGGRRNSCYQYQGRQGWCE